MKYDAYVTMQPMPTESEKKACPIAVNMVFGANASLKSGFRKKRYPSAAPGMNATRTAMTMRIMKSAGIITLAAFSIPFSTPRMMIMCVSSMNMTVYIACRGDAWKASNCAVKLSVEVYSGPKSELTRYSSDHPATM